MKKKNLEKETHIQTWENKQTMQLYHKWTYEVNRLELLLKEKRNVDLREQIEWPI